MFARLGTDYEIRNQWFFTILETDYFGGFVSEPANLCVLNLLFLGTCIILFSQQVLGLYLGLFYFIVIFLYHILG